MASAAAVASSSSEAPARGSPVRSAMTVWKLSNASRRPWLISAWYGVYCVYQERFSRMLRWMIGGVIYDAPTTEQLRNLKNGDYALLRPPPSKADQFSLHWGAATVYLMFFACSAARAAESGDKPRSLCS